MQAHLPAILFTAVAVFIAGFFVIAHQRDWGSSNTLPAAAGSLQADIQGSR